MAKHFKFYDVDRSKRATNGYTIVRPYQMPRMLSEDEKLRIQQKRQARQQNAAA
jgi:hypothetical protein